MKADEIRAKYWYENARGVRRYVVGFGGPGPRADQRYVIFLQHSKRYSVGLLAFARWAKSEVRP